MRALVVCALVLAAGCANVTSTKLHRKPNGDWNFNGGQNASVGEMSVKEGDAELYVKNLKETTSADIIAAQGKREVDLVNAIKGAVIEAFKAGAEAAK